MITESKVSLLHGYTVKSIATVKSFSNNRTSLVLQHGGTHRISEVPPSRLGGFFVVTLPQKTLQHDGSSWHWFIGHPDIEVFISCQLSQQGPACLRTEKENIEKEFKIKLLIFSTDYIIQNANMIM